MGIIPNTPNKPNGNNENNGNKENNNPNKPEKPNKPTDPNPNENNETRWKKFLKKPVNLFFMTLISCGIVGGFIIWVILKNQLNKKIGGKKLKKLKPTNKTKKQ